ncbi:hypothetical protein LPB72_17435 [Hydrogenophaga crassostreae]|uniref:Uncharacterized protein n=1 Tax=Hydrogenophaga crassostreae TaxID=1763535 RepID=A0A163C7T9_9BURK|nr:hypothetical protein [Hydrogenophaga crassostreae]AOW12783.1 hypothetical protein LPB072_07940 [Hydrogenophaga crassostreae]OAD39971.1 hypothetical protein LPB72_17435 [Hydrogenophaga crassostreae]
MIQRFNLLDQDQFRFAFRMENDRIKDAGGRAMVSKRCLASSRLTTLFWGAEMRKLANRKMSTAVPSVLGEEPYSIRVVDHFLVSGDRIEPWESLR